MDILSTKKEVAALYHPAKFPQYILITGGAGFVGINLADKLLSDGKQVLIFDNVSRDGVRKNLHWLKQKHTKNLKITIGDVRDKKALKLAVNEAAYVFHFAAQVAVTTSLIDPYYDFEVNALGTLNLLEIVRNSSHQPPVFYTSTNKVYGDLEDVGLIPNNTRYYPENQAIAKKGISEKRNLDFHSPYGCTKGFAEQYMLDYARTFGLKTVVFRMSCIYGPHQFGTEDQGWIAHFLIKAIRGESIALYGDGKQVRDILFIDDLVGAFIMALENIDTVYGHAFNIGGGEKNTVSLLELLEIIKEISGIYPDIILKDWRPSDQKYYVSDFSKFKSATGWEPAINTKDGITILFNWLKENADLVINGKHEKRLQKRMYSQLETTDK